MAKTLLSHGPAEQDEGPGREDGLLEEVVRDNVLSALGRPPGLYRVQVRRLWGDTYRVNVFTGADAASFRVLHSYFVRADGDGKIVTSCPGLARQY